MISIQTTDRNGNAGGAILVQEGNEAMLITNGGTLVRTRVSEVSVIGRNTQGVKIIGVSAGEKLISIEKVAESDDDEPVEDEFVDTESNASQSQEQESDEE